MQIIIPMTGNGSRFKVASYERLKPFIEVQGKPIIEWVVKMIPEPSHKITFVCRKEHLDAFPYIESELNRIAPGCSIAIVHNWTKKGPVYDIMQVSDLISDGESVIVSYCDYYMQWNYNKFKQDIEQNKCDGAVPCYTGFHPHLIPKDNLYASCKVDKSDYLIEIKEKFSWAEDKRNAYHSPGLYYFKTGQIMKQSFMDLMDAEESINDEFYVSLPFNYMTRRGLKVWCPSNIVRFCQWGTPQDLERFNYWISIVKGWSR